MLDIIQIDGETFLQVFSEYPTRKKLKLDDMMIDINIVSLPTTNASIITGNTFSVLVTARANERFLVHLSDLTEQRKKFIELASKSFEKDF